MENQNQFQGPAVVPNNDKKSQSIIILSVAILVAALLISGSIIYTAGKSGSPSEGNNQGNNNNQVAVDISKVKIEGSPYYGNVNAPVVMAYWSDYQCPFCKRHEEQVMPQIIKDYVDTGKVRIVFKDFQFLGPDSVRIGKFSRAVWEAAPSKYYVWHKAMYENQGQEHSGWGTEVKVMSITTNAIGATDAAKALTLFKSKDSDYQKMVDADKTEAAQFKIDGTPSSIIGKQLVVGAQSYDSFKSAIEAALNSK